MPRLPPRPKLDRHTPLGGRHHQAFRRAVRRVQSSAGPIARVTAVIRFPEIARLLDVCWLEITGKLQLSLLSPATTYAAYLVYSFTTTPLASSYRCPATTTEHKICLQHMGEEETMMHRQELAAPPRHHHHQQQQPAVLPQPSARPIAGVAAVVEAARREAMRRLLGCSGATPPPAPAHADRDVEMGLPDGESSASRPVTKPQPGY
uniref:Uncharacterized protein n=1 Tax=Oryza meridionalis TaxID=40149 RepID=A0A0E0EU44_9ORYZ